MKNLDFKNIDFKKFNFNKIGTNYSNVFEKIKKDKPFQKKLAALIVAILVMFFGTNLINSYQQSTIKEASSKQSEYQEIEKFLTTYNNDAEDYKEKISQVNGQIIEFKDIDKASILISELATNNNLIIASNNKKEKTVNIGNNIFAQEVEMTVTGEYGNILNFLNKLENGSFFISIKSLSIDTGKNTTNNNITAKISYQIFFVKA